MKNETDMEMTMSGPWDLEEASQFLGDSKLPVRLSCIGSDGFPRVISLWYQYRSGVLYCVTHRSSKLVAMLKRNNRVGFEIAADAPPYHGIRGQGTVTMELLGDDPALEQLLGRYIGNLESGFSRWLLSRKEDEYLIVIKPHRLFSWDYRQRMAEVV